MDLAEPEAHRALAYLAALEIEGYFPTAAELEAYTDKPNRRSEWALATLAKLIHQHETESMTDFLGRVGWAFKHEGRQRLSQLGRAMVKALDRLGPAARQPAPWRGPDQAGCLQNCANYLCAGPKAEVSLLDRQLWGSGILQFGSSTCDNFTTIAPGLRPAPPRRAADSHYPGPRPAFPPRA